MERTLSLRSLVRISRPINLLMLAFAQIMVAVFLIETDLQGASVVQDPRLYVLILATSLLAASGYMINDYYDVKIDYINRPKEVVVGKGIKRRMILALHSLFNFTALGLAWTLSRRMALLFLAAAILLWWYSNRLKRKPFVGNLSVAFLTALSLYVIAYWYQKNELLVLAYAIFAFFLNLIREIVKDLEDRHGDRLHGSKTLPLVIGFRNTKQVIFGIAISFVGAIFTITLQLQDWHLYVYFSALGFVFCWLMWKIHQADRREHFSQLSAWIKAIMLMGTLSMAVAGS
jgi:4-hydroxybenzoate polyprenyltransferase